jgi:hypothetical protein
VSARDRSYERGVLEAAEVLASIPPRGFARLVLERLDTVGAKHGDRFTEMGLAELLDELAQEPIDIGGWAVLVAQRSTDLVPEAQASRFRLKLLEAIAAAGRADKAIAEARAIIGLT